jgi:DNA-directed RNA polymerase specialized sigma24 family protein
MAEDNTTALQQLIDRLRAGDEDTRWQLVENAHDRLRGLAAKILNEDFPGPRKQGLCDTADLTEEVKRRMAEGLKDAPVNDVEHFFHRAAQNTRWILLDVVKRFAAKEPKRVGEPATVLSGLEKRSVEEVMAKLLELVEQLPEKQPIVVYFKFWLPQSDKEIAKEIGVATRTVQRLWTRAKVTLAKGIKQWLRASATTVQ